MQKVIHYSTVNLYSEKKSIMYSEGQTHSDPVTKANILNKQFESVFSKPSPLSLKQLAKSSMSKLGHPPMPPITIQFKESINY